MNPLKTILAERRTYTGIARTHNHDFAQLILPLAGSLFIETARHALELDDSRLFFLPPGCQHTFYAPPDNQFLVLDAPAQVVPDHDHAAWQGGVSPVLDDRWRALRFLLASETSQAPAAHHALAALFRYACDLLRRDRSPRSLQYIQAHYHQPLDIKTLAALEGFNPTYYCEWFKKTTGLTPTAYIQKLRLAEAKDLLIHTDLPILHIAHQVGYEHHASLTRLFQQVEQTTPLAYRRRNRK